jgi:hypothetical protein
MEELDTTCVLADGGDVVVNVRPVDVEQYSLCYE